MPFNPSIDVNSWKLIQWSADVPKLDTQLTELMLKQSTWATGVNQALSTNYPLADAVAALFTWTSFTLTVVPGAGAITTQSSNSAYIKIGKAVFIRISVSVSNIGTASGTTTLAGLPFPVSTGAVFYLRENAVNGLGYSLVCGGAATSGTLVTSGGNANPAWANGITYVGQGVYQTS